MEKYGFSLQESYALPMTQVIDLLADTGFRAVSPGWGREQDLGGVVRQARARRLTVQSLHGPLRGMTAMWSRGRSSVHWAAKRKKGTAQERYRPALSSQDRQKLRTKPARA